VQEVNYHCFNILFLCTIKSSVVTYYDWHHSTIHHVNCLWNFQMGVGVKYTNNVETMKSSLNQSATKRIESHKASSHANYKHLTSSEKDERIKMCKK